MRRAPFLLTCLVLAVAPASAQEVAVKADEAPAPAPPPRDLVDARVKLSGDGALGYRKIRNTWKLRLSAIAEGEVDRAAEYTDRIIGFRQGAGIVRLDTVGVALIREAEQTARDGDVATALELLEKAEAAAPGLPDVPAGRARIVRRSSPMSLHIWIGDELSALKARLGDFLRRMLLFSDAVLTLLGVLALLLAVFVLAQLLRYGLSIYHDLGQLFPTMAKFVIIAGAAILALFPLIFGFGPLLLFLPVAGLMWGYQSRWERAISVLFVVGVSASPWLLRMADRLTEAGTGLEQAIHALELNPHDQRATQVVAAAVVQEQDPVATAALGLANKRVGDLKRAVELLEAAIPKLPSNEAKAIASNNLGNAWFALGNPAAARAAYERASGLLPGAPEPVFNLHRLAGVTDLTAEAKELIGKATTLDSKRVTAWAGEDAREVNRFVIDMQLPASLLTERALSGLFSPTRFASRVWIVLAGPVPEIAAPVGGLALALFFVVAARLRGRLRLTWPCSRCGRPASADMVDGPPERPLCEQCVNLFVKNIPVDRRIRFEKEEAVRRYESITSWGSRVAGVLFPGFGAMVTGRPVRGFLFAALAFALLAGLVMPDGVLFEPAMPPGPAGGVAFWGPVCLLAGLWLYSAWRTYSWTRE